jgi:hypothetical protein
MVTAAQKNNGLPSKAGRYSFAISYRVGAGSMVLVRIVSSVSGAPLYAPVSTTPVPGSVPAPLSEGGTVPVGGGGGKGTAMVSAPPRVSPVMMVSAGASVLLVSQDPNNRPATQHNIIFILVMIVIIGKQ